MRLEKHLIMKYADELLKWDLFGTGVHPILSVNSVIDFFRERIYEKTSLEIKLLYFTRDVQDSSWLTLNALLDGFTDEQLHVCPILIEIEQTEADSSWITIYK